MDARCTEVIGSIHLLLLISQLAALFDYRAKLGIRLDNYGAPTNTQFIFTE